MRQSYGGNFSAFFFFDHLSVFVDVPVFSRGCDSKLRVKAVILLTEQVGDEVELFTLVGGPEQHHSVTAPI
jgi:hypothetical protein